MSKQGINATGNMRGSRITEDKEEKEKKQDRYERKEQMTFRTMESEERMERRIRRDGEERGGVRKVSERRRVKAKKG